MVKEEANALSPEGFFNDEVQAAVISKLEGEILEILLQQRTDTDRQAGFMTIFYKVTNEQTMEILFKALISSPHIGLLTWIRCLRLLSWAKEGLCK